MPVNYTNRKGQTYTLYQGQTRSGKPRYYFGRAGQGQGEPVTEIPPGYSITESVNGVVSLAKDRPSLIQPEEVAAIEAAVQRHPEAHRYRVVVKQNRIEIYERVGPDYEPVLRFNLLDPAERRFGVERMCYRGSIDGWLELMLTAGPVAELARELVPTLGTDQFFELW